MGGRKKGGGESRREEGEGGKRREGKGKKQGRIEKKGEATPSLLSPDWL